MSKKEAAYQSDLLQGTSRVGSKKTRDTGVDGLHDENLFDQDENSAGDQIDAATGIRYDNSTMTDEAYFQSTSTGYELTGDNFGVESDDVMGELHQEFDAAAKWLVQHEHDSGDGHDDHLSNVA